MKNLFLVFGLSLGTLLLSPPESSAQWVRPDWNLANARCFAASGTTFLVGNYGGVFLTKDNGTSWSAVDSGLADRYGYPGASVSSLAISGSNLFAGTDYGVFLSTNNGTNWSAVNSGLRDRYGEIPSITALAVIGTTILAGTVNDGVFLSTNNGTTWNPTDLTDGNATSFAVSGMNIFVSITIYPRLYLSANGGANWSAVTSSLSNTTLVWRLAITGTNIFAGTFGDGVFLSSDNGTSWSAIDSGLTYTTVYSLAITGSKIFAGTDTGGVFLSTNNGTNWTPVNEGLTDTRIRTLAVYGGNLFASTASDGVWRRSLSEMPTSVEPSKPDVPRGFSLCQNFPNPFNPTTTISFSLPSQAFVSLKVFDALGREVSTLVNEELSAGDHVLEWNAVNMPSGVYYYRLRAGASTQTRKLVLLR